VRRGGGGSGAEETVVAPDISVSGCDQKPPTRRETEIWEYLRKQCFEMSNVHGLEETSVGREVRGPGPDVPAARAALDGVAEAVKRPSAGSRVSGQAKLQRGVGCLERCPEPLAHGPLR